MDFAYSDDQRALRDQIVRFAQAELNQDVVDRDRRAEFRRDLWDKCGAMGILGLPVPEAYGGMGMDALTTATTLEALGYGCHDGGLVFSICAHILACVVPIWKHASEAQKQHYLPKLCDGSMIAVNAMTEPMTGSDAFAMSSRAVSAPFWSRRGPKASPSDRPSRKWGSGRLLSASWFSMMSESQTARWLAARAAAGSYLPSR